VNGQCTIVSRAKWPCRAGDDTGFGGMLQAWNGGSRNMLCQAEVRLVNWYRPNFWWAWLLNLLAHGGSWDDDRRRLTSIDVDWSAVPAAGAGGRAVAAVSPSASPLPATDFTIFRVDQVDGKKSAAFGASVRLRNGYEVVLNIGYLNLQGEGVLKLSYCQGSSDPAVCTPGSGLWVRHAGTIHISKRCLVGNSTVDDSSEGGMDNLLAQSNPFARLSAADGLGSGPDTTKANLVMYGSIAAVVVGVTLGAAVGGYWYYRRVKAKRSAQTVVPVQDGGSGGGADSAANASGGGDRSRRRKRHGHRSASKGGERKARPHTTATAATAQQHAEYSQVTAVAASAPAPALRGVRSSGVGLSMEAAASAKAGGAVRSAEAVNTYPSATSATAGIPEWSDRRYR
jgi:hypothetical protein